MGRRWAGDGCPGGLLLGRPQLRQMLGHWNEVGGPFKDRLNGSTKYVASSGVDADLRGRTPPCSRRRPGGGRRAQGAARGGPRHLGSGGLIRSLLPHDLIDEYLLMIHPVVLGSGQRLFEHDDHLTRLRLVDCTPTSTGVLMATYRPA